MERKHNLLGQWPHVILSLIMSSSAAACIQNKNAESGITNHPEDSSELFSLKSYEHTPADFKAFYQLFHLDSLKQLEFIRFPLKGLPDHADPQDDAASEFYYTSDQWVFHKNPHALKDEFTCTYLIVSDILVEEHIVDRRHGLVTIRRFAKTSSGWQLIYYAGVNKYSRPAK